MKIDQILNENTEQLDELSWQDVKSGAANTLGAIGKGIGGIASVPQGIARAVKSGYKDGVNAIGGPADQTNPQAAPAAQGGSTQQADTSGIESQIKQKEQELADLKSQLTKSNSQQGQSQKSNQTTQSSNAPADASYSNKVGDQLKQTGQGIAGAIKGAQDAMQAGVGMGASGQSLMSPKAGDDVQSVKDAQGKDHQYKKVGQQWVNMADNQPVDPATAAMLDRQGKQKAAAQAANAEMDKNAQGQQSPAQAQGTATQGADATARGDVNKGFGFNSQTGKPYTSAADAKAGEAENAKNSAPTPQQVQNRADAKAANPFGFNDQTGEPFKSQAEADAFNARRQKQATATQAANAEMDANAQAAQKEPAEPGQAAVWKNNRNPNGAAATSPQAAADQAAQAQQNPAVWKNNRAPEGTPASTSPQAAAATVQPQGKDLQTRMAKQLGQAPAGTPAQDGKPATPNFGQMQPGYSSVKMNAPTGIPQVGGPQPTTGAKAVPTQQPAPAAAPAPTASAQADANKPGFLQSKIKGSQVPAAQPQMAGTDFSAMLARKAKVRL